MKNFLQKTTLIGLVLLLGGCNPENKTPPTKSVVEIKNNDYSLYTKDEQFAYYDNKTIEVDDLRSFNFYPKCPDFAHDNKSVYFLGEKIISADKKTFECIENSRYSKDKKSVFYEKKRIKEATPSTFEILEDYYARDENFAYHTDEKIPESNGKTFEHFPEKFRPISNHCQDSGVFSKDNKLVFLNFKRVSSIKYDNSKPNERIIIPKKVKPIEGSNGKTFQYLGCNYAKDKNNIYYYERDNLDTKKRNSSRTFISTQKADPKTFELVKDKNLNTFGGAYSKDSQNVYYGLEIIQNADPNSFEGLAAKYAKDKNFVYYNQDIIDGADPNTFEVIFVKSQNRYSHRYAKDKNHVYYDREIFEDVDPKSFEVLDFGYTTDKNNSYFYKQKVGYKLSYDGFERAGLLYIKDNTKVLFTPCDTILRSRNKDKNCEYKIVEKADPKTFQNLTHEYAKDKNNVYHNGNLLEGIDPKTFKVPN